MSAFAELRPRRRARGGAVALLTLALAGCRLLPQPTADLAALKPVPLPELGAMEPAVRDQVQTAHRRLVEQEQRGWEADAEALVVAYGELGLILLAYDLPGAQAALENVALLQPKEALWHYYLGRHYRLAGRLDQAERAYARVIELEPKDPLPRIRLAQLLLDAGRFDEAAEAVDEVLRLVPEEPFALALLGQVRMEQGQAAQAADAFERALELAPAASRLHYLLAQAYRRSGDLERAEEHMRQRGDVPVRLADPLASALDHIRQDANADLVRGNTFLAEGRAQEASQAFATAVARDTESGLAYQNLGVALAAQGELGPATEALERAVSLAADSAAAWTAFGVVHEQAGRIEEAEAALREALRIEPESPRANRGLADLLRRTGRCAEAVPRYETLVRVDPSSALHHVLLAMCRVRDGAWDESVAGLDVAADSFPEDRDVADARVRVSASRPDGEVAAALVETARANARRWEGVDTLESLAMSLASAGAFEEARRVQEQAIERARAEGREDWAVALEANLARYAAGQGATAPWPDFIYGR